MLAAIFKDRANWNNALNMKDTQQVQFQTRLAALGSRTKAAFGRREQRRRYLLILFAVFFVYVGVILAVHLKKHDENQLALVEQPELSPVAPTPMGSPDDKQPKKSSESKKQAQPKSKAANKQAAVKIKPKVSKKQVAAVTASSAELPAKASAQAQDEQQPDPVALAIAEPAQEQPLANTGDIGQALPRFIKINESGEPLPEGESQWSCVKDENNGLVWENKTDDGAVQDKAHLFTWYQADETASVNSKGVSDGGRCKGGIDCDTHSYVQAMNEKALCGFSDWRLPTREEMRTLITYQQDRSLASVDIEFFPNAVPSWYWTASENDKRQDYAWYVLFRNGVMLNDLKKRPKHIMLVRSTDDDRLRNRELAQE